MISKALMMEEALKGRRSFSWQLDGDERSAYFLGGLSLRYVPTSALTTSPNKPTAITLACGALARRLG